MDYLFFDQSIVSVDVVDPCFRVELHEVEDKTLIQIWTARRIEDDDLNHHVILKWFSELGALLPEYFRYSPCFVGLDEG